MKKKNVPRLGPNNLYFCFNCSLPILDTNRCPSCGQIIKKVPLTPPYDVRPASKYEIHFINKLISENFGIKKELFDDDDIVMFNHIGSEDQMDEVVYYGTIIGSRRYDILANKWIIKLNEYGLKIIEPYISKNWVIVDNGAIESIINGSNLLIPGVIDADPNIKTGDYIAIMTKERQVIAGGIAKIDEITRKEQSRGTYAKNYKSVKIKEIPKFKKRTWKDVVRANEEKLREFQKRAIRFIRKAKEDLQLPIAVSFSGGKDSLVTAHLAMQAISLYELKFFFVNTGVEFPETLDYVVKASKELGFSENLYVEEVPTEIFWQSMEKLGPPARDYRYCCKFAKLAPIKRLILRNFESGKCISLVGQRRYESYNRSQTDTWQNQYIPNQINISPIQNWTALMVWLYIFWQKLPYNPLYDRAYERIGCWLCPSSNMAQIDLLKESHNELYSELYSRLLRWKLINDLPETYITKGLWRFKKLPKKITSILKMDDNTQKTIENGSTVNFVENITISNNDGIIVKGSFVNAINMTTVYDAISLVGKVTEITSYQISIEANNCTINLFDNGTFYIKFNTNLDLDINHLYSIIEQFVFAIIRAEKCLGCKLCENECKFEAIKIVDGKLNVLADRCTHCGDCYNVCPLYTIAFRKEKEKISRVLKL